MVGPLLALVVDRAALRPQLRPHQAKAIEMLRQSLGSGKRRPLLQAPTGYGKTVVAAEIIRRSLERGNRVVFSVPALSLIDQTIRAFHDVGICDVGVIQADHIETDWSRPVQIASVQTLMRRRHPEAQLVLIDEVHKWFKFYGEWMAEPEWKRVPFIGFSATPWTRGLGRHFDDLIISATTQDLIDAGFLSPFRVFAPAHPDLSGVKTVAGDYHEGQLAERMNQSPLVADIVATWIERGEGRPTLCFGVDCAHAKHIQQQFEAAGVPCGYQDAYTQPDERERIRQKFHNGELKVVSNIGTLTTGVDWDVRCIILARPTRSEMLFCQIVGRGLRTAPGKDTCIILDHSDTTLRLGFVTDIHHEMLDDGRQRDKAEKRQPPLPKECPSCAYLRPAKVRKCPACGFVPEVKSNVDAVDGELVELRPNGRSKGEIRGFVQLQGRLIPEMEFYGQLKFYAHERGWKDGWASNKFKEKVGVWPAARHVPALPVSHEVASWIRSRQIAWAKSQKRKVG